MRLPRKHRWETGNILHRLWDLAASYLSCQGIPYIQLKEILGIHTRSQHFNHCFFGIAFSSHPDLSYFRIYNTQASDLGCASLTCDPSTSGICIGGNQHLSLKSVPQYLNLYSIRASLHLLPFPSAKLGVWVKISKTSRCLINALDFGKCGAGGLASSTLHLARSVCRRAERSIVSVYKTPNYTQVSPAEDTESNMLGTTMAPAIMPYINRLSDYLFTVARIAVSLPYKLCLLCASQKCAHNVTRQ